MTDKETMELSALFYIYVQNNFQTAAIQSIYMWMYVSSLYNFQLSSIFYE